MVQIGLNKALFEKRLELNLSRKEAAKLLGISKFKLTLLERGYLKISKKNEARFISAYGLDEYYFVDYYKYPIIIDEKLYEPINPTTFFDKLGSSKKAKIISIALAIGFIVMCAIGVSSSPKVNGSTPSFYSEEVKTLQKYVISEGKEGITIPEESDFSCLIPDRYFYIKEKIAEDDLKEEFTINFFKKTDNLPYAWTTGMYKVKVDSGTYKLKFQSRFLGNNTARVHFILNDYFLIIPYPLSYITCDISFDENLTITNYNFISVLKANQGGGNVTINPGDEGYEEYTTLFKTYFEIYVTDLGYFFDTCIPLSISLSTFMSDMNIGNTIYFSNLSLAFGLTISGFIFSILALGVFVLSLMFKDNAEKRAAKFAYAKEEQDAIPVKTEPCEVDKKELPRNKWIDMVIPEFGVRVLSLLLLFASSIGTYMVFANAITINITGTIQSIGTNALVTSLSVLAVMLLYFVKLDIYQNKKSAFATNIFLFILGLLYYLALLLVYYGLVGLNDTIGTITDALFNLLPGNIVWAVLVFNLIIIFMFAPLKESQKNKPHAELKARLLTLIPFSYLVASCIISIGLGNGWKMPYAVSSLFFYKAPMITVFAIVYCIGVFIYRRVAKKKYGEVNGIIYQNGNKYNFCRNIIAFVTVAAIGIFDLMCFLYWPKNPAGFGTNWLMLFALPFILFYHPHIGKRNGLWDTIFLILYGLAYVIGIVLIVFAILNILVKL